MLSRVEVEDFLFHEAELLDDWKLEAWTRLYQEDAIYEVTSPASPDPVNADPAKTLFLVADKIDRIRGRATRLMKKTAHAEYPHSKTRHMVSNVRPSAGDNGQTNVRANFAVYRTKEDTTTVYMGEYRYRLVPEAEGIRIVQKRIILDLNSLYDQGRLTIIL
ncbi:MAG: aromatic-ring-hydroxylating dioxygenase subunit beta [Panacagrimonas sp.]